jgi:hypothetical protein
VAISSANISGITANLSSRSHHQNQTKPSIPPHFVDRPVLPVKSQIKQRHNPFPSFIAINSQLQEGLDPMRLNGTGA